VIEIVDRYDERTGFTAMQRLTGWHGSIMLIAANEWHGASRSSVCRAGAAWHDDCG